MAGKKHLSTMMSFEISKKFEGIFKILDAGDLPNSQDIADNAFKLFKEDIEPLLGGDKTDIGHFVEFVEKAYNELYMQKTCYVTKRKFGYKHEDCFGDGDIEIFRSEYEIDQWCYFYWGVLRDDEYPTAKDKCDWADYCLSGKAFEPVVVTIGEKLVIDKDLYKIPVYIEGKLNGFLSFTDRPEKMCAFTGRIFTLSDAADSDLCFVELENGERLPFYIDTKFISVKQYLDGGVDTFVAQSTIVHGIQQNLLVY